MFINVLQCFIVIVVDVIVFHILITCKSPSEQHYLNDLVQTKQ